MIRALFGGSFDPIHAGHVAVVDLLLARGLADIVHVVPARRSPLKATRCAAGPLVRLRLVELALSDRPQVVVDDREVRRTRPSYTVRTLAELAAEHAGDDWRLVMGADQAVAFARWRQPERLLELAEPVILARGPVQLAAPLAGRALVVADFDHPASASLIRGELAAGRLPGQDLLPAAVAAHIAAEGLYGLRRPRRGSRRKEAR